jgi:hypothetical protein
MNPHVNLFRFSIWEHFAVFNKPLKNLSWLSKKTYIRGNTTYLSAFYGIAYAVFWHIYFIHSFLL